MPKTADGSFLEQQQPRLVTLVHFWESFGQVKQLKKDCSH